MTTPTPSSRIYWSRDGRTGHRRGGGRYVIARWEHRWLMHDLPAGRPTVDQPAENVPWIDDTRTLRAAQRSCAEHLHRATAPGW